MENSETFEKYLDNFGYATADFYQALDDILSSANYDYKRGNLTIEQLAIITKMAYYLESMRPSEPWGLKH